MDKVPTLWGKLSKDRDRPAVHTLLCHMLDTGTVAELLVRHHLSPAMRRWLADGLGTTPEAVPAWIGFIAASHDIGKATLAFQSAGHHHPEIKDRLQSAGLTASGFCIGDIGNLPRHDCMSQNIFRRLTPGKILPKLSLPTAAAFASVLGAHHGVFHGFHQPPEVSAACGDLRWEADQSDLLERVAHHWGVSNAEPVKHTPGCEPALVVLTGLICIADWIASCETFFPYAGWNVDLDAYTAALPTIAGKALRNAGWQAIKPAVAEKGFRDIFAFNPNTLQQSVETLISADARPGLVLIEAPTGNGKTEAAYRVEQIISSAFGHDGVYVAMPTQATSNQAWGRLWEYLANSRDGSAVPPRLLHSNAMLMELDVALPSGVGSDMQDALDAQEWFASSKRGLLAASAVGTIDQSLMAVLHTRHFFVRLFGLAGKLVILDEVHAYDTFTSTHLQRLLAWLGAMQCPVILLSATLPSDRRKALIDAYTGSSSHALPDQPYPRVTIASTDGVQCHAVRPDDSISVCINWRNNEGFIAELTAAVANGGCAAVICNTVQAAQHTYEEIRNAADQDTIVWLLHARFPFAKRDQLEKHIVPLLGKEGRRNGSRPHKAIVVATQVIEQSLDLDFDLMVSELAPIDLLLQRAGRLHRHTVVDGKPSQRPPDLESPAMWILTPQESPDGLPDFGVSARVYEEYLLLMTLAALRRINGWRTPDDLDELIDAVYGDRPPDMPQTWQIALATARDKMMHRDGQDEGRARNGEIPLPGLAQLLLDGHSSSLHAGADAESSPTLVAQTRKPYASVQCVCLVEQDGLLRVPGDTQPISLEAVPSTQDARRLLMQSVTIPAWVFAAGQDATPPVWKKSSVMRRRRPLIFKDGIALDGRLRLDEHLGLVIMGRERQED